MNIIGIFGICFFRVRIVLRMVLFGIIVLKFLFVLKWLVWKCSRFMFCLLCSCRLFGCCSGMLLVRLFRFDVCISLLRKWFIWCVLWFVLVVFFLLLFSFLIICIGRQILCFLNLNSVVGLCISMLVFSMQMCLFWVIVIFWWQNRDKLLWFVGQGDGYWGVLGWLLGFCGFQGFKDGCGVVGDFYFVL